MRGMKNKLKSKSVDTIYFMYLLKYLYNPAVVYIQHYKISQEKNKY